jgi:hypothetical protein
LGYVSNALLVLGIAGEIPARCGGFSVKFAPGPVKAVKIGRTKNLLFMFHINGLRCVSDKIESTYFHTIQALQRPIQDSFDKKAPAFD